MQARGRKKGYTSADVVRNKFVSILLSQKEMTANARSWLTGKDVMEMKKRILRGRSRKEVYAFFHSMDSRNRWVMVATCLAVWCLLLYYHFAIINTDQHQTTSNNPNGNTNGVQTRNLIPNSKEIDTDPTLILIPARVSRQEFWDHDVGMNQTLSSSSSFSENHKHKHTKTIVNDRCHNRYVYIHSVPREFNEQLLDDCSVLKDWSNMCIAVANAGLGPEMKNTKGYFTNTGWFETNQFTLELIFHNRMKQYDCLTEDATKATAVYVPFYAGLEATRSLWDANLTLRDAVPNRFADWVTNQPEWKMHNGWDHFIVGGRITWDFRRKDKENWGNRLLQLPAMQNMTSLVIEGSPWAQNDVGIPYPTYFHPSSDMEIMFWQSKVRKFQRKVLFSFAGGARATAGSIRGNLIDQCRRSEFCKFLSCDMGACQTPQPVMKLFEESTFCLQPQGDSATRRSIFDSMLAGCIPVFFHQDSYSEYKWHFPEHQGDYSVFIDEQHLKSGVLSLEFVLRRITAKEIKRLRENIIRIIPDLVYADPRVAILEKSVDAFDIAIKGITERIAAVKKVA